MYSRILNRLSSPLMISDTKFSSIYSGVIEPILMGKEPMRMEQVQPEELRKENNTAIIPIKGVLVSHNGAGNSGSTSYESISSNIRDSILSGAKTIVFNINSPGGEVSGAHGLAHYIQQLPKLYNVKTVGIIDGDCCSAAYLLASGLQSILATDVSTIGSIGVIASLANVVEKDKKDGIAWTILRSDSGKALLNPHEEFPKEAVDKLQEEINVISTVMKEKILAGRKNLSIATIDTLNGGTIQGSEAVKLGFIDGTIDSIDVSIEMIKRGSSMNLTEDDIKKLQADLEISKSALATAVSKSASDERERCLGILEAAKSFGLSSDIAIKQINLLTTVEQSVSMFEMVKEAIQMANPSPVSSMSTAQITREASNPITDWIKGNETLYAIKS